MSVDQIVAEALRLPVEQRVQVAASLWESIEDPFAPPLQMDEETAIALAIERDRQMEAGEVTPILHDEMMRRLRG